MELECLSSKDFYPDELQGKLKDDVIARYFRCRYADRDEFKKKSSPQERELLENEEERLLHIRAKLRGVSADLPDIKALNQYRREWKEHARAHSDDALKRTSQKFNDLKKRLKKRPTKALSQEILDERRENERRILKEVQKWPKVEALKHQIPPPANPNTNPRLEMRVITLEESQHEGEDQMKSFKFNKKMRKHPIDEVLGEGGVEIMKREPGTSTIRYFHVPANDMDWIERLMANYYEEPLDRRNYDDRKSEFYRKGASNVLRREFWRGQQHGSNADPIHARHMRPRFSVIPPARNAPQESVQNFALFMPFLHWEMSKRRARMTAVIKECAKVARTKRLASSESGRMERREFFDVVTEVLQEIKATSKLRGPNPSLKGKLSPWGKYMLQIARVFDMMDCEHDEMLLREDLFKPSPLHPRRTLDQSYHWKLESTARRDQDQVVYRGTSHPFKSRKVVMVDQLWMWILDENTIITSFPRRWGRNKPDPSGVHRGIRDRLEDLQEGDIRSVYDLASLIIDQCSRIFFDRTKPVDERPEVLDIFANAIANVSDQSTNAFDEFWSHMQKLNRKFSDKKDHQEATANYFNIDAEGLWLCEAYDISEELKMMQRVYGQQIHITKEFKKALLNASNQVISGELALHVELHTDNPPDDKVVEKRILGTRKETGKFPERRNHVPEESITKANNLLEELEARKGELEDLESSAKDVSDQLNTLLSLKQQQASALEAKAALERAEESVMQGRSIMVFTIVTIIFLPLGFMSSIFGMNNTDFMNHPMELRVQFKYMFTISLGVILISVGLAFSGWWLLPLLHKYLLGKSSRGRGLSKQEMRFIYEKQNPKTSPEGSPGDSVEFKKDNEGFLSRYRQRRRERCLV